MPDVALVTDSSACLPPELIERHGIAVVPLSLLLGSKIIRDGALPAAELFERLESSSHRPTTAAPAPGEFLQAFRQAEESGPREILCLTLSSRFSGTHSSALNAVEIAAREAPNLRVRVADTHSIAGVHGFAVLAAARALERGASVDDAVAECRRVASRAHLVGALDTLRFLARSGRVPRVVHWAASALSIRPVLAARGEEVGSIARTRSPERAAGRVLRYLEEHRGEGGLHVAVLHAAAPGRAEALARQVCERFSPAEMFTAEFTSVMSVHTGPGFVGLAFYSDGSEVPRA